MGRGKVALLGALGDDAEAAQYRQGDQDDDDDNDDDDEDGGDDDEDDVQGSSYLRRLD